MGSIDSNKWSVGRDLLVDVPAGCWQIQRINSRDDDLVEETIIDVQYGNNVWYGNAVYAYKDDAIGAARQTPHIDGALIVIQQGCTDMVDSNTAIFLNWYFDGWYTRDEVGGFTLTWEDGTKADLSG